MIMNNQNNKLITTIVKSPTAKNSCALFKPLLIIGSLTLALSVSSCVEVQPGLETYESTEYRPTYSPGYRITSLPTGYRTENISGTTYYYHDGHYYQPNSDGYAVVTAPTTSTYYSDYSRRNSIYNNNQIITRLPSGYRVVQRSGNTYYQAGDRYYSRQGNGYVIVERP